MIKNIFEDIDLYYILINKDFLKNKEYFIDKYCNANDLEYINQFIYPKDQNQHLASIILQKSFTNYIYYKNIQIKRDMYNKPFIQNLKYNYNISHDNNIVVGVFSEKSIGIDIMVHNDINFNRLKSMKHIFNVVEKNINYISLWTITEAYLKAIGIGFNNFENRKFYIKNSNGEINIVNGKKNKLINKKIYIDSILYNLSIVYLI